MTTYSGRDFWAAVGSRWPIAPLRRIATVGTGHTPSRGRPEYWEECTIPWVTTEDLTRRTDSNLAPLMNTRQKISRLGLENSAAVIHPTDTVMLSRTASVGHVVRIGKPMATTQAFVTWTCGDSLDPRFLVLVLNAMAPEFRRIAYGSTHLTIYMPDVEQLYVPVPPLEVQRAIADYAESEVSRIDLLIRKKRVVTERLRERRLAVTHAAVRGELRGAVNNRKNSNVAWLPSIPEHWQDVPLTRVARLGSGHTPSRDRPEWWQNCDIPWITTGEVSQMRDDRIEYIRETREKISRLGLKNSSAELHPAGTVVLCRTAASAGYSAIMATEMATSQDIVTWTTGELLEPRFLLLCLRAMRTDLLDRLAQGSTHKTIYMPEVRSIRIPLPPLQEQRHIVDEAWRQLGAIDRAVDRLGEQERLLKEHRRTLITAAVTGELEIPGVMG